MIWKAAICCTQLWLVLTTVTGQLTEEQKEQIVDLHNMYRSKVEPSASNMIRMKWDEEISKVAANYAAQCIWEHNPDIQGTLGENLFMTTGSPNIDKGLANWFNEHEHYDYNSDSCAANKMCGHYTQMVWAQSTLVGCAANLCETVQGSDYKHAWLLVCNYEPAGNMEGDKPYEAGESCSGCPDDKTYCIDNACDDIEIFSVEPSPEMWPTVSSTSEDEDSVEPSPEMWPTVSSMSEDEDSVEPSPEMWPTVSSTSEDEDSVEPTLEMWPTVSLMSEDERSVEPSLDMRMTDSPVSDAKVEPSLEMWPTVSSTPEDESSVDSPVSDAEVEPSLEIMTVSSILEAVSAAGSTKLSSATLLLTGLFASITL